MRLMHLTLLLVVAACGSPASTSAQSGTGGAAAPAATTPERPFAVTPLGRFGTPWAMTFLPGRDVPITALALVSEKAGQLWLVDTATGTRQQVAGLPRVHVAGQGGLGDVVVHPDFAGNQRIYLSFVEAGAGGTSGAAVGYGRLVLGRGEPRIDSFTVIWRQYPKVTGGNHFSHRIAFSPDGTMFVSSGDRFQFDPAQDRNVDLGKIIHMTAEGRRMGGGFYSMGHRNVLGLAFAPDGRLWETEMGPKGGDELNLILPGRNYGWPSASNGSNYDGSDIPDHRPGDGFEPPKKSWNPSVSPAGIAIYTGDLFPQWKGDALIPALSGKALIRVDLNGDAATMAEQWDMGARIRAVDQGPGGELYLLEDGGSGGRLLRLTPSP